MKITTTNNNILIEELFIAITLKSPSGEELSICMRDTGFEFNYQGTWYSAKQGSVTEIVQQNGFKPCSMKCNKEIIQDNMCLCYNRWLNNVDKL